MFLAKTLYIPSQLLTNKINLMKRTLLPLLLIVISCILGSCSFDGLQYVRDLQETLVYKYEAEEILVKVQNKELIVTLKNSPLEDLSAEEKQGIAREIGALALAPEKRPALETGKLVFEEKSELGIASYSEKNFFDMQLKE